MGSSHKVNSYVFLYKEPFNIYHASRKNRSSIYIQKPLLRVISLNFSCEDNMDFGVFSSLQVYAVEMKLTTLVILPQSIPGMIFLVL